MIAEILATGDEIRSGTLVDSNSAYIAQKLEETGIAVVRHHSVGDDMPVMISVLREIASRADVSIVTGGLGPTSDDLTAEAAAAAAGVPLFQDPEALEIVEAFFRTFHRPISTSNIKQSYIPEGSTCLANPIGTAPGFMMKLGKCLFFFLPGVPSEMRRMLSESVLPRIEALQGGARQFCRVKTLTTFGLTESMTGERLKDFPRVFPEIQLGFRAKFPEIQVKFYLRGTDADQVEMLIRDAGQWVSEKLGHKLISPDGESMEAVVGRLLFQKKSTLAVAESCTGGLIAHWLTNVAGSSDYFLYSGVVYANQAKVALLGVSQDTLNRHGAVHEETAREMASRVRRITSATYGLATSGIAGPGGGTDEKPVGTVCIGLATPDDVRAYRFQYRFRNREMNKQIFAMTALDLLRRELLGVSPVDQA
ncbi:MAG: competence/damage-inducible protein A [Deltaproteobacteria bacterium]|nr:competence/damage-inducible protein A [Deltaproteobacteria bacterium]